MPRAPKKTPDGLPPLPAWARRTLYGYQLSGTYAIVGGHAFLCDEPGLGKTIQSIAAHAVAGTRRLLVITPPVALTNWVREIAAYGLAYPDKDPDARPEAGTTVMVSAGRKVREFPDQGVVVVPDSLLASRPELRAKLRDWAPDGITVDESHRHKNWATSRARAVRSVAQAVTGLRVPISGTPMTSNPYQLASQLAISGHLDTIFGGLHQYLTDYCTVDQYGRFSPRKRALEQLNVALSAGVWVRRNASEVYNRDPDGPTMPEVLPPRAKYIDLDATGSALYRAAIVKQHGIVDEWLDSLLQTPYERKAGLAHTPTDEEVRAFAASNIGFISPLRKAAGVAKVPAAIEYITDWIAAQDAARHDRPLLVWCHHNEVATAMRTAIEEAGADVAVIDGATSAGNRGKITADFQAGRYKALVLSMQAAGVGITLTRACDNLFVESDWEPTTLTQARDRTKRIGQTRAITLTTLLASGTLDEHLQRVQRRKAAVLDPVLGGGYDTSVATQETDELASVGGIIAAIVAERVEARSKRSRTTRAAA
nr:DEAD/DEAH box helicase [Cellulomonas hominis]